MSSYFHVRIYICSKWISMPKRDSKESIRKESVRHWQTHCDRNVGMGQEMKLKKSQSNSHIDKRCSFSAFLLLDAWVWFHEVFNVSFKKTTIRRDRSCWHWTIDLVSDLTYPCPLNKIFIFPNTHKLNFGQSKIQLQQTFNLILERVSLIIECKSIRRPAS